MTNPMKGHYTHEFGSYYWWPPGSSEFDGRPPGASKPPSNMVDQVTIGFTRSEDGSVVVVHKHGDRTHVDKWASESRKRYMEAGYPHMAAEISTITFPPGFDVDEINRCLDTVGYLTGLLDEVAVDCRLSDG